jgi:TatD DNase family protein
MYTDTHVHFDHSLYPDRAELLLSRAREAGVSRIVAVGGAPDMNEAALCLAIRHPDRVRAAVGLDRHLGAAVNDLGAIERMIATAPVGAVVALGETGLDFHHAPETAAEQKELMRRHLELACALRLPVVVHTREAVDDTMELLTEHAHHWPGDAARIGVIHCYTGDRVFAERLMDLGFVISFSGIVTFRNADPLREVARHIPVDRLVIETDTPYLAPVPHRGQPNEPAFLPSVAAKLAEVRGVSVEDLARLTAENAARLFGWGSDSGASQTGSDHGRESAH